MTSKRNFEVCKTSIKYQTKESRLERHSGKRNSDNIEQ